MLPVEWGWLEASDPGGSPVTKAAMVPLPGGTGARVLGGWVLSVERLHTKHISERAPPRDPAGRPVVSYSATDGERMLGGVGSPSHTAGPPEGPVVPLPPFPWSGVLASFPKDRMRFSFLQRDGPGGVVSRGLGTWLLWPSLGQVLGTGCMGQGTGPGLACLLQEHGPWGTTSPSQATRGRGQPAHPPSEVGPRGAQQELDSPF